jgi:exodeoxyribonuclease-5
MLTEVHRQALGSPVIQMATRLREYGWLGMGEYGDSRYLRATADEIPELILAADQVICGTHRTRHAHNAIIRAAYGFEGVIPMPGEKLLCCHNGKREGMLNGSLWEVLDCERSATGYLYADLKSLDSGRIERTVKMHAKPFAGRKIFPEDQFDANEFDWGYVFTVHKAQGSQWPHVALIHDGWHDEDNFLEHWLYTAITRAQERVTIIKRHR